MRKLLFLVFALFILTALSFASTTFSDIEDMSGWQTCTTCAGGGSPPHGMSHTSSPSQDGSAGKFSLGGSTPYSDAIWWKDLGGSSSTNFVYDLYFYITNTSAPQALEFDVNDTYGGHWWVFGTECNYRQTGTWRVFDTGLKKWVSTGIGCAKPNAYAWNHVTIELQRVNGKANVVAVTLNGSKHYLNRSYGPKQSSSGYQISVAFQEDGNYQQADYSVWIDNMKLTRW